MEFKSERSNTAAKKKPHNKTKPKPNKHTHTRQ